MLEAQPIIHPRDAARRDAPLANRNDSLSQIIKTTGSIRSSDDQTESLLMFVLTRARYSSSSSASFSGSIYAMVSSISAARLSVYSPSTGVKHTRCVRAAS